MFGVLLSPELCSSQGKQTVFSIVRGEEPCSVLVWWLSIFFGNAVLKAVGETYAMCQKHPYCLTWASHDFLAS